MRKNETIISLRGSLWLKISIAVFIALVISYFFYRISEPRPGGGTTFGLVYGFIGLGIFALLMYFGVRKRSYVNNFGTLKDWLSFHIYFGVIMIIITAMHAGFDFGFSIHSLAFYIMIIVVVSGIVGTHFYLNLPADLEKYGDEISFAFADSEMNTLINRIKSVSKEKSAVFQKRAEMIIASGMPGKNEAFWIMFRKKYGVPTESEYFESIKDDVVNIPKEESEDFQKLTVLALQKFDFQRRFLNQIKIKNKLRIWLVLHLPLSIVLSFVILIHILIVVYYNGI